MRRLLAQLLIPRLRRRHSETRLTDSVEQIYLRFAAITSPAQAVATDEFTMCALDPIATVHSLSECLGPLLAAAMLQSSVMLTND